MDPFDLESIYDEQIAPLMTKIIKICKKHDLPFVASFCFRFDEDDGADLCTSCVPRGKKEWLPNNLESARLALLRKPFFAALTITTPLKDITKS